MMVSGWLREAVNRVPKVAGPSLTSGVQTCPVIAHSSSKSHTPRLSLSTPAPTPHHRPPRPKLVLAVTVDIPGAPDKAASQTPTACATSCPTPISPPPPIVSAIRPRTRTPTSRRQGTRSSLLKLSTSRRGSHPYAMAAAAVRRRPTLSPVTPPISPSIITSLQSAIPLPLPPQPVVPTAAEVIPRIYLGDLYAAESGPLLSKLGITHVVSAMRGALTLPSCVPSSQHLQLTLDDNPFAELAAHLPRAVAFVRSALDRDPNARILIHCVRGVSRSAAVVAAVLISLGWTPERAIAHIARIRPGAQPNIGFVSQLGEYARTLEPTARV